MNDKNVNCYLINKETCLWLIFTFQMILTNLKFRLPFILSKLAWNQIQLDTKINFTARADFCLP